MLILDATAGNRKMWQHKNSENIIYIDIEKRLEVPPTMFADYTQTPFPDNTFDTIFFDPPHSWGEESAFYSFPTEAEVRKIWPYYKSTPSYYGWDKYKHRQALVKSIYLAAKEFHRILKPDGLLWFKWNEIRIPLNRIIVTFVDWTELMRLYVNDPTHAYPEYQTFWICMCKKAGKTEQIPLELCINQ